MIVTLAKSQIANQKKKEEKKHGLVLWYNCKWDVMSCDIGCGGCV
jgi:hypothetical protein